MSWLREGWLDFTEPEDWVKVVECVCVKVSMLKGVRADGMDFREQGSTGLRVNRQGRENKSVVIFQGLKGRAPRAAAR